MIVIKRFEIKNWIFNLVKIEMEGVPVRSWSNFGLLDYPPDV